MATGDTKLKICNDALIMLGTNIITSFSDGSSAAQITDRLYDDVKVMLLTMYPWSFSMKKQQLAKLETTPVTEWKYEFALPGDLIAGAIVNADINASAAIAATKIAGTAVTQADSGTVTLNLLEDYDLESEITDSLYVDANNGNIQIDVVPQ